MLFHQPEAIRYLTFDLLDTIDVPHAVFTRKGGVSSGPWASLNVGGGIGDEQEHVVENRKRSFIALGRDPNSMFDVWQVHGTDVAIGDHPRPLDKPYPKADIIMTDRPDVTLYMRFGDCVPILLYDPDRNAACLAHAGWQGTVKQVGLKAVQAMQQRYGSSPASLIAAIGPSICVNHYQVGEEVIEKIKTSFSESSASLLTQHGDAVHLDLWKANELTLYDAGVRKIEVARLCTAEHPEDWFSHRGEHGKTGRFGALIAVKS